MANPRRSRVRAPDVASIDGVAKLRATAIHGVKKAYARVFHDPVLHKRICHFLYSCYLTAPGLEPEKAEEFWLAYRHFVEGKSILDFDFRLIDATYAVAQLRKILRGDPTNLDLEETEK